VPAAGDPASTGGCAGLSGALYTGRGPVCGTIIRGGGAWAAAGAVGLVVIAGGCACGVGGRRGITGGAAVVAGPDDVLTGGTGGFGLTGAEGATGAVACGGPEGAGTVKIGRGVVVGTTNLG